MAGRYTGPMDPIVTIRLATRKDAPAIALESMTEIEHGLSWTWNPDRVAEAIRDPNTNVAVAVADDAMLGFGIMRYEEEVAHLLLFAVHEDSRRRGVGSALLAWLEKVASVAGVNRLRAESRASNAVAREFYRKHGYVETGVVPRMYAKGVDGIRFEKVVAPPAAPDPAT